MILQCRVEWYEQVRHRPPFSCQAGSTVTPSRDYACDPLFPIGRRRVEMSLLPQRFSQVLDPGPFDKWLRDSLGTCWLFRSSMQPWLWSPSISRRAQQRGSTAHLSLLADETVLGSTAPGAVDVSGALTARHPT